MSTPYCTYRIQLHSGFRFRDLASILDYLHELGISCIYSSPVSTAFKGSTHGYNVTDPLTLSTEIGTFEELERIAGRLKEYGMNWLQDIVPNHMAYTAANPWLYDVLERGKGSPYYSFFDIESDHPEEGTRDKLLAPFLGKTLNECLRQGEIKLDFGEQGFIIRYFDMFYPVAIPAYKWICTVATDFPEAILAATDELEVAAGLEAPEWQVCKQQWLEEVSANKAFLSFIRERIAFFNERVPLLAELLNSQHYMLTHAHLAASRINYRRFFAVNTLICLRMENESVFTAYHKLFYQLYKKGCIQGLRVDHIDGLADPRRYIERLRKLFGEDCFIIAEKILAMDEQLPENWQLQGTTGYEFLSFVNQLLVDQAGCEELRMFYKELAPGQADWEGLVFDKKYGFLKTYMAGELNNLLSLLLRLPRLSAGRWDKNRLKEALALLMAAFPVYRIYPEADDFSGGSRKYIQAAFLKARQKGAAFSAELEFLQGLFEQEGNGKAGRKNGGEPLRDEPGEDAAKERNEQKLAFIARLMQFTVPLAAKGIEDTSFYVYNLLLSRNEVGDSPGVLGISADEFHIKMSRRRSDTLYSLNATATHDTKRGEDSRIRLNLLSAVPGEWIAAVKEWRVINASFFNDVEGRQAPSPNDEYFIYQSILSGIPEDLVVTDTFRERLQAYMTKALREAKTETSWDRPDEAYEKGCFDFIAAILDKDSVFLRHFLLFAEKIVAQAAVYSLSQLLIKLTAPGIPDIYQGTELWDLSYVDPYNRRPVDYTLRLYLLRKIKQEEMKGYPAVLDFIASHRAAGAEKLFILSKALVYRRQYDELFAKGEYLPVKTTGALLSYIRRLGKKEVLVIVPLIRKDTGKTGVVAVTLPDGAPSAWRNEFTGNIYHCAGDELELSGLFAKLPVALLTAVSE